MIISVEAGAKGEGDRREKSSSSSRSVQRTQRKVKLEPSPSWRRVKGKK